MSVVQEEQGDRGRFPWFKTPHMDRLARGGVRFRNAFVVNSLCSPSRTCFLTGRYSHHNGIANNHTPFPVDNVTHATLLRAAGYITGYVGKWHMDGQKGQRPGFDYSASFVGQGRYFDCPMGLKGTTVDAMVLNIDLAPTLLDFAGVAVPNEIQGRSVRPLLEGKPVDWRKAWFYEYFFERGFAGIPTVLAARTETAKIIKYPGHDEWTEVFDLRADPYEKKNLANDPAHKVLREQLEAEFERQKVAVGFRVPAYADKVE